jgi:hypothetical protein
MEWSQQTKRTIKMMLIAAAIGAAMVMLSAPGFAHTGHLAGCVAFGLADWSHMEPKETHYDVTTNSFLEMYDRDGDGLIDFGTVSPTREHGKLHANIPTFYFVGPKPDLTYIDKMGKGRCKDIVLYEDLRTYHPLGQGMDHLSNVSHGRAI